MEPKYLKSLGNQDFQHYTGLRVLPQMRGDPIWLDPGLGQHRAAASGIYCVWPTIGSGRASRPRMELSRPSCAGFIDLAVGSVGDQSGGLLQNFPAS
jgi:hypothetical protein